METRFEWDDRKAESNRRKHGVSFRAATRVFLDPARVQELDDRFEEERWQTIGMVDGRILLLVAHTVREASGAEIVRIISARPAEKREREKYEQQ